MSTVPLLAFEVMDKELSARVLVLVFVALGVTGFFAGLWRRWAAVLVLIGIVMFTGAVVIELRDPFVGPAMGAEAGWGYIAALFYGFSLSSISTVAGVWVRSRRSRGAHG